MNGNDSLKRIESAFSRRADVYRQNAKVQAQSARILVERLALKFQNETNINTKRGSFAHLASTAVDLGCGAAPIFLTKPFSSLHEARLLNYYIGLDLSHSMLVQARAAMNELVYGEIEVKGAHGNNQALNSQVLQSSFEKLPLASASCGLLVSNFALQWCQEWAAFLEELVRVSAKNALIALAFPVEGSFTTLSEKLAEFDLPTLNQLPNLRMILNMIREHSDLRIDHFHCETIAESFPSVSEALNSMKIVGAGERKSALSSNLPGKFRLWRDLLQSESAGGTCDISVEYKIGFVILQRT